MNTIKSTREDLTLSNIYELIKSVNAIPMVRIQVDAIKKYQQLLVENNQRVVHEDETH
jgi:histone H3/H4